jgi:hypothetical protein
MEMVNTSLYLQTSTKGNNAYALIQPPFNAVQNSISDVHLYKAVKQSTRLTF